MFRRHSLDEITQKNRNKEKNRKRNLNAVRGTIPCTAFLWYTNHV